MPNLPKWFSHPRKPNSSGLTAAQRKAVADGTVARLRGPELKEIKHKINGPKQLDLGLDKQAKSFELIKLIDAKELSDQGNYRAKNKIMGGLLHNHPEQFVVDSILNERYSGITHKPSGFKIHVPRKLIPPGIEHRHEQQNRIKNPSGLSAGRK